MSLSRDDVEKIAHLAMLAISEEDIADYASDLSNILDLVGQMEAVDTDSVTPMAHPLNMPQRLRPDVVTETDQRDRFQQNAPSVENGLFLVPRVVE
ncbi:Asp-tRNA(Asn)/Glu-tRNA(Gln) amidotransferase subunit GatC [Sulfuriflexus sp.]|uniref:Asp-tRNA(Asn)/Glu-tRNA(Gln) amidotransferase subunit GatC n=1 Tax=Sulfuriflexus sp. TaxID=2015443 RepID=UPI0028CEC9B4|nr:Asp-tRNA(Asn)/Glu-tRNA(Gln) amidotransferase subunit GatC [Sulfuriflexus sp.]MDT8404387.1 Asp-tRNA(Asn)/Glu-tRNA(Gln) amidotransferase subunit GatC [Sulfuriflexus sp.]